MCVLVVEVVDFLSRFPEPWSAEVDSGLRKNRTTFYFSEFIFTMKPFFLKVTFDRNRSLPESGTLSGGRAAANYLKQNVFKKDDSWREQAYLLTLDKGFNVTGAMLLSVGSLDSTVIDNKLVLKTAIDTLASGVILAHNHPSGNVMPSAADIKVTEDLKRILDIFSIKLVDHIILADDTFYSFNEDQALQFC